MKLSNYEILNQIYESSNSQVYRAIRKKDHLLVIIKLLQDENPNPEKIIHYKQEYEIVRSLKVDGVIEILDYEENNPNLALIFEDFGAISLKDFTKQQTNKRLSIRDFLPLAITITNILGEIHQNNIIHKDINPANIVYNHQSKRIKIIDFGISTKLRRENPTLKHPNIIEGTLSYISPEQTGRMNRSLDYRTDFYSLGVTFYQLLTGKLPFQSDDLLKLVHHHLAIIPLLPHEINPEIPVIISHLIMKLMAKNAEDRYQSAWGIKADLEQCLNQLENTGKIKEFVLGKNDFSSTLNIPQKLYGRNTEIEQLLTAFQRIQDSKQTPELLLVSGYSGIGKTSLVQEIYQPITEKKGYFIGGKFDQLQRHIPYYAFIKAFQQLIRQILTEDVSNLQIWQQKFLTSLDNNGQILIDLIPELELIIGPQPEVIKLDGTEAQNRFNFVFQQFLLVFSEFPLVIFIDDLQWSDLASLQLIELILTNIKPEYLLLIGAYRDNEVNETHPLKMTINSLTNQGVNIREIVLQPLLPSHLNQLLIDTFHRELEFTEKLGKLIKDKTEGNPFFVNELIKEMYANNLIYFNLNQLQWQWEIEQINLLKITDNVVDLLITKLQKLLSNTQYILSLASCIGIDFDLSTLSLICEQKPSLIFKELTLAIQKGLIIAKSELNSQLLIDNYQFSHDRFQQAAYSLIKLEAKKPIHLKIARLLLLNLNRQQLSERLFEVVDHFNQGREHIENESEKLQLIELNLEAAKKAKKSTAYQSALGYLSIIKDYFNKLTWQSNYELTFNYYQELSLIEYLNGNFENSEKLTYLLINQTKTNLEKAKLYNNLIVQKTMEGKNNEAIELGKKALQLLGINLPETDLKTALNTEIAQANSQLQNKEISSLLSLPEITIPEKELAVHILMNIDVPAYLFQPELYPIIVGKMTNISLQYGLVSASAKAFVTFGLIQGALFNNYKIAYEFGILGLKISEKFNSQAQKCKACLILANQITSWVKHIKYVDEINQKGYQAGLESGELQFSGYIIMYQLLYPIFQGINLDILASKIPSFLEFVTKIKNQLAIDTILGCQIIIQELNSETSEINETQYIKNSENNQSFFALCQYYLLKAQVLYLDGEYETALTNILQSEKLIFSTLGLITIAEHNFYYSLILTSLYDQVNSITQEKYLQQIETNQKQLQIWAENCPENFLHKYLLIKAEIARISQQNYQALELYDQAINSAQDNEFIQNEALANELATQFWLTNNKPEFAEIYLKKAYYNYQQWGAKRKVEKLKNKYPQLIEKTRQEHKLKHTTTSTSSTQYLDLVAIMKASQAIYNELLLDKLLISLMTIIIENAGAEVAYLILEKENKFFIEAKVTSNTEDNQILQSISLENNVPKTIINYVINSLNFVVLDDAENSVNFGNDAYIKKHQCQSIICYPLLNQNQIIGVIYLENNLAKNTFTPERIEVLKTLSAPAAIAIKNAKLYTQISNNQKQLNQFLEAMPMGIAILDKNGQPYYANQVAIDILQKPVIETLEKSQISEFYENYIAGTNEIYPNDQLPIIRALKGEKCNVDDVEIHLPNRIIPVEAWSSPIYDSQGNIEFAICAFQDITQRKQVAKILAEYNQVLEQQVTERTQELSETIKQLQTAQSKLILSEKMAALGQLVAGIAHEINTPLGAIQASINNTEKAISITLKDLPLLLEKLSSLEQKEFFNLINIAQTNQKQLSTREQRQYKRNIAEQLIANNINSSRQVADTLVDIGIYDHINDFLEILQHPKRDWLLNLAYNLIRLQSNNKTMITAIERATKVIFALKKYARYDHSATKQPVLITEGINTVLELYHNQIKKGIELQLNYQINNPIIGYPDELMQVWTNLIHNSIQAMNGQGKLMIDAQENAQEIIVKISDSGCGIPETIKNRIFEPFFTTKSMGEGSGLGLDIVKKIIDKHQGKITVESEPCNTTFTIFLPKDTTKE